MSSASTILFNYHNFSYTDNFNTENKIDFSYIFFIFHNIKTRYVQNNTTFKLIS